MRCWRPMHAGLTGVRVVRKLYTAMARILIVEDAAVDRALARELLEESGEFEVTAVENGKQAIEAIEHGQPDLVVTDLIMPEMSGLELVEEARDRFPLLPIILMTSRGSEEIAVEALNAGAASYVPKHLLVTSLANTVDSVLAASRQRSTRADLMKVMVDSHSSFELGNDRALFRPLIQYVQDSMAEFGLFDQQSRTRVGVALEEALNNAAEHGNLELDSSMREEDFAAYVELMQERSEDPKFKDRRIRFDARFTPGEVCFEILDEGRGFDPSSVPHEAELDAVSGRGLRLMRMFMDDVEFNETGNQVRLRKRQVAS